MPDSVLPSAVAYVTAPASLSSGASSARSPLDGGERSDFGFDLSGQMPITLQIRSEDGTDATIMVHIPAGAKLVLKSSQSRWSINNGVYTMTLKGKASYQVVKDGHTIFQIQADSIVMRLEPKKSGNPAPGAEKSGEK